MENAIYCELVRRGLSVDVGVIQTVEKDPNGKSVRKEYEIDFVVNRGFRRVYIQSAYNIDDSEKRKSEKRSLSKSGDFFRKIIITGGNERMSADEDGIIYIGVIPFMLNPSVIFGE